MHNALLPAGLPTQPRQGAGARFLRRLGGAVRSTIALAAGLRRPAAPQSNPPAPQGAAAPPQPRKLRAPRRPRAAAPAAPPRPGWFARWFGLGRRHRPLLGRPPFPEAGHAPFTPETHPGLAPELCDFLNTPVEECDPDLVRVVLAVLARQIADSLPPELGIDANGLFSTLCGRLGTGPSEAPPDATPAEAPAPAATPTDGAPDAPPACFIQPPAPEPAAPAAIAACPTTPEAASAARPVFRRRPPFDRGRWSRHRRRSLVHRSHSSLRRGLINGPQRPPPRRLYYAACAGPP